MRKGAKGLASSSIDRKPFRLQCLTPHWLDFKKLGRPATMAAKQWTRRIPRLSGTADLNTEGSSRLK
jgi:hypothetical protein